MMRTVSMIGSALLLLACASENNLGGSRDNLDEEGTGGTSSEPEGSGGSSSGGRAETPGTGGQPQACTLIGCGPQFTTTIQTTQGFAQVRAATLKACLNTECYESELAGLGAEPPAPNAGAAVVFPRYETGPSPLHVTATYWVDGRLVITWNAYPSNGAEGDVYTITLTGAGNSWSTTLQTEDLVYTVSEPNGPGCGTCTQATW